jgi:xanthine dehydrogenase YagR molybdenum-binding subunit
MTPTFTRGSGEAVGVFTLECMMDEPASQLGIDPIELRLRNLTEVDPNTGNPGPATDCGMLRAGCTAIRLGRAQPAAAI